MSIFFFYALARKNFCGCRSSFEVVVNGTQLIFSKYAVGTFPDDATVARLAEQLKEFAASGKVGEGWTAVGSK